MISLLISMVIGLYLVLVIWFWLGWERISIYSVEYDGLSVSIIIPVRNEAANIRNLLNDINDQIINATKLEVIVVNDNSEDNTKEIVSTYLMNSQFNGSLINLNATSGKKAALKDGIGNATGDIIITIDGDCRVGKNWVASLLSCFNKKVQMVSGPVVIASNSRFFENLQMVEFASLIGSGAATLGWNKPTMCNGANLAFRRMAYQEVGGYSDSNLASGDDVFLMHKFNNTFSESVVFCKSEEAIVTTAPAASNAQFFQQRKRWAGKWGHYKAGFTKILALIIYMVQLTVILSIPLAIMGLIQWIVVINLLIAKAIFEYFFLKQVVNFLGKKVNSIVFLSLQIIYPFYVIIMGFAGLFGNYNWKNRSVR